MNLSQIELSADALRHNVAQLRGLAPTNSQFIAVVKGNAYGHGLEEVAKVLDPVVDGFQVDDIEELRALRQLTSKRILVLGYVPLESVAEAAELGGELAIYDLERLPTFRETRVPCHLKIDALLGRQGILPEEVPEFIRIAQDIDLRGVYAHFANIEDTTDLTHAQAQIDAFQQAERMVLEAFPQVARHYSATSGLMTVGGNQDLVRIGVGLYGLYPSEPLRRTHVDLELRPVITWRSHLAQVKVLPAKHPVGYGLTYVTSRETRVGIVPQGYADGVDRGLSNTGEVLVRGVRCPMIGRVAMNMFAVDLSAIPDAKAEEEVVLLGRQGSEEITAEEVALRLGTINYEVVTRISPLLPRVVTSS